MERNQLANPLLEEKTSMEESDTASEPQTLTREQLQRLRAEAATQASLETNAETVGKPRPHENSGFKGGGESGSFLKLSA